MDSPEITTEGFLVEFMDRHKLMPDRPFCWILGSGASFQSGIPTGSKLVAKWLEDLHKREHSGSQSVAEWATEKNLGIPEFDYQHAERFYPFIYERRYRHFKDMGYAFLEDVMAKCEPSFGYSVLAQIMATTSHKAAITTNFDNLIADALSIYTGVSPLVCGHESLTGYINAKLRRPLVAKIHRDLLLHPLNDPKEIAELPAEWVAALKRILANFSPIVIGYGGNDGSLMGFLKSIEPIAGGIFWCHRADSKIDTKVHDVINHHKGHRVRVAGFDEFMLQLQEALQLPLVLPHLEETHKSRVLSYQKQFEDLSTALKKPAETKDAEAVLAPARKAAEAATERLTKEKDWWAWQLKAYAETDVTKRDAIYQEGLRDFSTSAELIGNYAIFLCDVRKDTDAAEVMFKRAIAAESKHARSLGNYAVFLRRERKDMDAAEAMFKRAIEADPKYANGLAAYAEFLRRDRKDMDAAEAMFKRAIEADPDNANILANFAGLLLAEGKIEGLRILNHALDELGKGPLSGVTLECAFYLYAHGPVQRHDEALRIARRLIDAGTRSPGWDLSSNTERAIKDSHPEAAWLKKLADVIGGIAPPESLDAWPSWQKAGKA